MNYFQLRRLAIRMSNAVKGFIRTITGVPPVTLTDCVDSRSVKNYQIYGNSVQVRLPQEYQEVEYIESTGTQYIDTGYMPNQDTTVKVDFELTDTSHDASLFGVYSRTVGVSSYAFGYLIFDETVAEDLGIPSSWLVRYNDEDSSYLCCAQPDTNRHILNHCVKYNDYLEKDFYNFLLDDRLIYSCDYPSGNNNFIYNFEIFASYHETEGAGYNPSSAKLYSFKIYESGELVRDFIPCYRKNDSVIGLYDLVEDKFYTNQGTGTFLKGADYVDISPDNPVEVKSVGEYDEETGKYKIPVTASGKNLFDLNNKNNWVNSAYSYYSIYVGANKTVSISWDNDLSAGQGFYLCVGNKSSEKGNGNVNTAARWLYGASAGMRHNSIKVTADAEGYIFINMSPLNLNKLAKLQVEYSTTSTEFEPYVEPITTNIYLNEPLRANEGYIDFENGKVVRYIYEGNLTNVFKTHPDRANAVTVYTTTTDVIRFGINTNVLEFPEGLKNSTMMCNILPNVKNDWLKNTQSIFFHNNSNYSFYISFTKKLLGVESTDTVEQKITKVIEYIKNNDMKVYYIQNSPTEEKITLPTLPTFKGKSVTYTIDTEVQPDEISVTYYSNTKGE